MSRRSLFLCPVYGLKDGAGSVGALPFGRVDGRTLEEPVDDVGASLPVLVPEQGVDEGVACRLAVGQTLAQYSPLMADMNRGP